MSYTTEDLGNGISIVTFEDGTRVLVTRDGNHVWPAQFSQLAADREVGETEPRTEV